MGTKNKGKKRGIKMKTKVLEGSKLKQLIFIGTKNIFKPIIVSCYKLYL